MNIIDIILIIPIIWFAYVGFKRGLIIELASLLALILGIYAALYFSFFAENFLENILNVGPKYRGVFAFILTFIVVIVIVHLIGRLLEKVVNMVALGFLNKMAGGIFGILKGAVILSIVLLIISKFDGDLISQEKKEGSLFYNKVAGIAPMLWEKLQEQEMIEPPSKNDVNKNFDRV